MAIVINLAKNDAGDFDLVLTDGKVEMVEDAEAAAIQMTERVLVFRSECIESPIVDTNANPLAGLDWYGIVFRADASRAEKEAEVKRTILSTPTVKSILEWSWTQTGRTLTIAYKVRSIYGELSGTQEFTV